MSKQNKEPLNFIYADDDIGLRTMTPMLIKKSFPNYDVMIDVVESGEELIDRLTNGKTAYHGVISDNTMGNLSGIDALALTRNINTKSIQRVPTVIFSTDTNDLQERVEAQYDAKFLHKPTKTLPDFYEFMHSFFPEYAPEPRA